MTKLLNLDEFEAPTEKVLKLKGTSHVMTPMSVSEFIASTRLAKKLAASGDIADHLEAMIDMIHKAFPTCPKEHLEGLKMEQLNAIVTWAQSDDAAEGKDFGKGVTGKDDAPVIVAVDFGFMFCRVMRFYGLSYRELMATPIKAFWLLSKNINRLRAEEEMRDLAVEQMAVSSDAERVKQFRETLDAEIGTIVVQEEKLDRNGLNLLKTISGRVAG